MNRFSLVLVSFFVFHSVLVPSQYDVECFRKEGMNDTETIQAALDCVGSKGHGKIEFEGTRTYIIAENLELPRYGSGIIILEGNGCVLQGKKGINIFNRIPENQKEALGKMMNMRFYIQNFTFEKGDKAINLGATFGSKISDCSFYFQKVAAVDIQFGLMTSIENCMSTLCSNDNFILRCGLDWGGNGYNSQSNHSHIKSCRVFAAKESNSGFKVLGSNGVTLEDVISEGFSEIKYSIYVSNSKSIAHLFYIKNVHIEHNPTEAGIFLAFDGYVTIDGLFFQTAKEDFPIIKSVQNNATNHILNVRWCPGKVIIQNQGHLHGIKWHLENCHSCFYDQNRWKRKDDEGNWIEGFPKALFKKS